MIKIDIQIEPPNKIKDFLRKTYSRLEDMLFCIIQKIPERFIPGFIAALLERYTTRRIDQLKQQIIKDRWKYVELEAAVENILTQQQDKKEAPSEE